MTDIKSLILNNISMADNMAKKYLRIAKAKGISLDELKSSARYALCEAAIRFDDSKKVKFQTFAYNFIKGQLLHDINATQHHEELDDNIVEDVNDNYIDLEEKWEIVSRTIDTVLTQRERKVIRWKHGIDSEPLTFSEIARLMHLSKDKVMSIHKIAYGKLRKYVNNNKFNNI